MTVVVGLQFAVGEVPHLHKTIPSTGHDDGVVVVGRETYTGHPVVVRILNGVLALSKGVPQLQEKQQMN